jgi:exopolyphosphatase/guanosine-5'-triphosphate,3'-diphosphate pyrophosphatase
MHKPPAAADPRSRSETSQPEIIAAVDLGSNSFHMIVGELRHGQLTIVDGVRETVRLAEGLSALGDLSHDARYRALECLSRFGERLRAMNVRRVRTAGTSTFRRAHDHASFMADANARLGFPIEVISGVEEARLIYSGVLHSLPPTGGKRLVADIGGGSTELVLGQADRPEVMESLRLGCVLMTERYFPKGQITAAGFDDARASARHKLEQVIPLFDVTAETRFIGASGTIRATERVAVTLGLVEAGITRSTIETLIQRVLEFDNTDDLSLSGLSERRAQVWPGGLCILAETMRALRVTEMQVSDGALREGLLYDLLNSQNKES